jgi:hypothetical protein
LTFPRSTQTPAARGRFVMVDDEVLVINNMANVA